MTVKAKYERTIQPRRVQAKDYPLGKKIGTSKSNPYGCPVCMPSTQRGSHTIYVFENGVQFPCGCIVDLPPLHSSHGDKCMVCNPVLATVTGLRRKQVA